MMMTIIVLFACSTLRGKGRGESYLGLELLVLLFLLRSVLVYLLLGLVTGLLDALRSVCVVVRDWVSVSQFASSILHLFLLCNPGCHSQLPSYCVSRYTYTRGLRNDRNVSFHDLQARSSYWTTGRGGEEERGILPFWTILEASFSACPKCMHQSSVLIQAVTCVFTSSSV